MNPWVQGSLLITSILILLGLAATLIQLKQTRDLVNVKLTELRAVIELLRNHIITTDSTQLSLADEIIVRRAQGDPSPDPGGVGEK